MEINRLTDARVRQLKERGYYNDGGGLYLRIGPTGAKSWVFRYRAGGKQREAGLGPAIRRDPATGRPEVTLVDARIEAAKHANAILALRHGKAEGYDPIERRREMQAVQRVEAASRITFRKCATEFIERNEAGWSNKHRTQWTYTLRDHVYPFIGDLPVAAIDTGLVVQVLDPLWNTKNETANRVRGRIEAVLDYATVRKYREGPNPAQWKGNLAHIFPARSKVQKVEHLAALPYREIGEFMKQLREQGGVAARALEFAILTAARTGEVLGARWTEIDMNERVWTVPASRMKAGKEHRVPLSDAALVLLENQRDAYAGTTRKPIGGYHPATDEFVFPGARPSSPLSNMALLMTLRRMGRGDLTAHGFRSTFRDWAAERTVFPNEVAEMALAHAVGDKVEAAYRRGDMFEKRRGLAEAWAGYCERAEGAEVVPLRA